MVEIKIVLWHNSQEILPTIENTEHENKTTTSLLAPTTPSLLAPTTTPSPVQNTSKKISLLIKQK